MARFHPSTDIVQATGIYPLRAQRYAKAVNLQRGRRHDNFGLALFVRALPGGVHLKELKSLQWLDLSGTQVTDIAVAHLRELPNLQWLNLSSTNVSDSGIADLKRALPAANIWKRTVPGSE